MQKFDLIVIGSGPAGEKAAVKAAYFGYKVAIIEKEELFGGAGTVTGTLPSKTLRETALYFSDKLEKGLYGIDRTFSHEASMTDFMYRKNLVKDSSSKEIFTNLSSHHVSIFYGVASFENAHTIRVQGKDLVSLFGEFIIIATGSYPYHPENIPFDNKRVHDSDTILQLTRHPSSLCIVGAGVIGCEYATIFATIGTHVYLINDKEKILPHLDEEISNTLVKEMQSSSIDILFNTSIESINVPPSDQTPIEVHLKNNKSLEVDMFLFAAGRSGNIKQLKLEQIGVKTGKRELIIVDHQYRTNISNIFAVGDVIGFPALASTSMEQGRIAVAHIFQTQDLEHLPTYFPYGIYTIPEVSTIGLTTEEAKDKNILYATGKAYYANMPRGKIMGAKTGMLKLLFHKDTLQILGVHIIGRIATEIIHYGVILVEDKKTLHHIISQVFNCPTLHDLYKYAAYDGLIQVTPKFK
ncbi:Si-specific NAD(P)(+) transhydrogenase [Candidatus Rhabdochlamydia porcellionis]|uniref:Soluble pyridine nucleotide transhydrogenase n=1 Tax=Candidatus Rhabdochlamydia porcellionis TaxID=225148 RepID=A0ABX8Z0T2_9BACT|nr:Si-specific NAD(P)(+) transhydrogenase [Candidatus Rhabdochlamydia porcellionis]QZA59284.1 Soluble pyridine nucleotide transhydrogenase [Candidatus Rhabdochlamydia porcellionis]